MIYWNWEKMNAIFFKGILIQSVRKDNENARNESNQSVYNIYMLLISRSIVGSLLNEKIEII